MGTLLVAHMPLAMGTKPGGGGETEGKTAVWTNPQCGACRLTNKGLIYIFKLFHSSNQSVFVFFRHLIKSYATKFQYSDNGDKGCVYLANKCSKVLKDFNPCMEIDSAGAFCSMLENALIS